ncbi:hypothetical protein [Rhodococcus sp. ARC_M6]|nr:hypothetical protein [Rhodococcus sp. ARC_M6]MCJ0905924.1 hypothetical protein [Rhodococcus sp. ARC_M6]
MLTLIDAQSTQSHRAHFRSSTLGTAELKLPIALVFGDPIAVEMTTRTN